MSVLKSPFFTASGTTENPKGVRITHKNLISNIKGIQSSFKDFSKVCNENDKSISFLPWVRVWVWVFDRFSSV